MEFFRFLFALHIAKMPFLGFNEHLGWQIIESGNARDNPINWMYMQTQDHLSSPPENPSIARNHFHYRPEAFKQTSHSSKLTFRASRRFLKVIALLVSFNVKYIFHSIIKIHIYANKHKK